MDILDDMEVSKLSAKVFLKKKVKYSFNEGCTVRQNGFTKLFCINIILMCVSGSEEAESCVFTFVHVPSHLRGSYYGCGLLFNTGTSMDLGLYFRVNGYFW